MRIQLVGFPMKLYHRLKELKPEWESQIPADTAVRYVPSRHPYDPRLGNEEVNQIRANVQEGFVHIAALPTRHFNELRVFKFDCRVIKLDVNGDLALLDAVALATALGAAIEYETKWCAGIKPASLNHPLLLPPSSFKVTSPFHNYWGTCDCYRRPEALTEANNALQGVASNYRHSDSQGAYWVDTESKKYSVDRSFHGMSEAERRGIQRYRFAYGVPHGFHFDVIHIEKKKFSIDSATRRHHNCVRVNIDPWGNLSEAAEVH